MKTPKSAYQKDGDSITEVAFDKAFKAFNKENTIKPSVGEVLLKKALSGKEQKFTDKADEKQFKLVVKFLEESKKNKEALNDQIAEAEEADKKRGELMVAASNKGGELAANFEESFVAGLQAKLGKKFVASETGIELVKGQSLDEAESAVLVSFLAESSERAGTMKSAINLALGDGLRIVRSQLGDEKATAIIEQVVSTRGQSKHTVQQTEGVVERIEQLYPDHDDRPKGLTYTHWQEVKNAGWDRTGKDHSGKQLISTAKLKAIIAKTVEGRDGKVLACSELRELLRDARPDAKPKPTDSVNGEDGEGAETSDKAAATAKAEKKGYLYVRDIENVYKSPTLDKESLKLKDGEGEPIFGIVIDLDNEVLIRSNGKKLADIKELSAYADEAKATAGPSVVDVASELPVGMP